MNFIYDVDLQWCFAGRKRRGVKLRLMTFGPILDAHDTVSRWATGMRESIDELWTSLWQHIAQQMKCFGTFTNPVRSRPIPSDWTSAHEQQIYNAAAKIVQN